MARRIRGIVTLKTAKARKRRAAAKRSPVLVVGRRRKAGGQTNEERYNFTDAGKVVTIEHDGVTLTVGVHLEARNRWAKEEGESVLADMVDEVIQAAPRLKFVGFRLADATVRRTRG